MDIKSIQIILSKTSSEQLKRLEDFLQHEPFKIVDPPILRLLHKDFPEYYKLNTYLDEIKITFCSVSYYGYTGKGNIIGHDPVKALICAKIDSIMRSKKKEIINGILMIIHQIWHEILDQQYLNKPKILTTFTQTGRAI